MDSAAEALIASLQLAPHPEGGWFRRVYTSRLAVPLSGAAAERPVLSAILYLLAAHEHSAWHRIDADEAWLLESGGPLELLIADAALTCVDREVLTEAGPRSAIVPAGSWQAARSAGPYALARCLVAPAFEYSGFSLLTQHPESARLLRERFADLAPLL
jgi:predicted cupin superfamily sugar epimerase